MPRFNNLVGPSKKGSDFYYITHEAKAERGREYQRNYVYQKKSPFQQMMSLQVNSDSLKGISPKDYPQLKEVLNIQRPLDTNRIEDHLNDLFKDTQVDVAAIEEKAKIQPIALTAANLSVTTYKRLKMLSVYKDTTVEEVIDAAINQMWENTKQEF